MSNISKINYEGYNKDLKALGNRVVIKRLEKVRKKDTIDGIALPRSQFDGNYGSQLAEIIDITEECSKNSGLKKGDKVIYDQLAIYYGFFPITVIDVENILLKVEEIIEHE